MKLEQILGTISIPLEHEDVSFRLVPFTNAEVLAWNRATFPAPAEGESPVERAEKIQTAQLDILASKFRACVVEGSARKVTAAWVGSQFPQTILQELAEFFAQGERPKWAGESGN